MKVKAVTAFKIRGELITPGTILKIQPEALPKLTGKVEPVKQPAKLICPCCRGKDFWWSWDGRPICRRCHPPAPGAEAL
jgi:hypothetical protein